MLKSIEPFVYTFFALDYFQQLRSWNVSQLELVLNHVFENIQLLVNSSEFHLNIVVLITATIHIPSCNRVDEFKQTSFSFLLTIAQEMLADKASSFFSEPYHIIVIIKIFAIPLQNVKQFLRLLSLLFLPILFDIGSYHHKQTVGTNTSCEVRVKALIRKNVFQQQHKFLQNGHFAYPILHQYSWLIPYACDSLDVYCNIDLYCANCFTSVI